MQQRKRPSPEASKKKAFAAPANRHDAERARKAARRGERPGEDSVKAAKVDWEKLRQHNLDAAQRSTLVDAILARLQPLMAELLLRHDVSRILQTVVQYGTSEQRSQVLEQVKPRLLDVTQSHYGHFLVLHLIKHAAKEERGVLISSLEGHVEKLLKHAEAVTVLEEVYKKADGMQRQRLLKELYGPEEALFGGDEPLAARIAAHPERRTTIVKALRKSLNTLAEKQLLGGAIAQHLLADLFQHASREEAVDLVPSLAEQLLVLGATRNGARAGVAVVAYGTAKERKLMIKALKGHACAMARHPHAHPILLALLRWTDDTVLLSRSVVSELLGGVEELAEDQYALLSLLALLAPPSPAAFPGDLLALLAQYDAHAGSKKSAEVRLGEIRTHALPQLVPVVKRKHEQLLGNRRGAVLVELVVSLHEEGETKEQLSEEIAEHVVQGDKPLIQDFEASRALKRLAKGDKSFRQILARVLTERAKHWAMQRGADHVVLTCVEAADCPALAAALRPHAPLIAARGIEAAQRLAALVKK